jgi:glycolate oxidase FAD binding subunit
MREIIEQLADTIRTAAAARTPLCIRGGGSKDFYGGALRGEPLAVAAYRGIVDYEPSELVMTARAGTPLADIEAALRERGQMLAFEPPHFDGRRLGSGSSPDAPSPSVALPGEGGSLATAGIATLGGCIAAGLSGPRRAYAGAVRDFVLGIRMLDGNGTDLQFGGRVMKNVAGFDVSRLMAGAMGTLGVILEVSLKVLPLPVAQATLRFEKNAADAITAVNQWAGQPLPISATAWHDGTLAVRLSGAAAAVKAAITKLGGETVDPAKSDLDWLNIREHSDAFFTTSLPLWRLSVKSTAPTIALPGAQLIEWGGALRWLASGADAAAVRAAALAAGGHATLFRGGDKSCGVFHPLPAALMTIHRNLKRRFDPAGIFNPGRLYDALDTQPT